MLFDANACGRCFIKEKIHMYMTKMVKVNMTAGYIVSRRTDVFIKFR